MNETQHFILSKDFMDQEVGTQKSVPQTNFSHVKNSKIVPCIITGQLHPSQFFYKSNYSNLWFPVPTPLRHTDIVEPP